VRESEDEIEQAGMERTRQQVERADLVLHVVDASGSAADGELPISKMAAQTLLVLNKVDLGEHESWRGREGVRLSCLKGEGIEALGDAIFRRATGGQAAQRDWSLAINARHQDCLERAARFAAAARQALVDGLSPEFVAEELRAALDAVGEVVGKADSEDVLGKIFGTFCIGK
jgi:tRNA modification GTPase